MKNIRKIVLTGGPCSGKTTSLSELRKHFESQGFRVLTVSETATDLLSGGISPFNMDNVTFQYIVTSTMRFKEKMMYLAAETVPEENVLIICDRAQMDNFAYMTPKEQNALLEKMGLSIVDMRDGYDAVFYLETSASLADEIYNQNCGDNAARYESAREAIETAKRSLSSWVGHPHLRVIPAYSDFNKKIERLLNEVEHVTGLRTPVETERSFFIKKPTPDELGKIPFCRAVEIEQCYIKENGGNIRVRRRGEGGSYIHVLTEKKRLSDISRVELERTISEAEYEEYKKRSHASLIKTRYCFVYDAKYFELDIYPYSDSIARLELELSSEDEEFTVPDFLNVICEITGDDRFNNHSIAINKEKAFAGIEIK